MSVAASTFLNIFMKGWKSMKVEKNAYIKVKS